VLFSLSSFRAEMHTFSIVELLSSCLGHKMLLKGGRN
jgi:hypothetical protein